MVNQRRYGPLPATHTGICPVCRQRRKVSPSDGRIVRHQGKAMSCAWRLHLPVPGSLVPLASPAVPRTCKASWHAPGSGWDYPCNVLAGGTVNRFAHKDPDIHRHTSNGLTIEWIDSTVSPTEQIDSPR